MQFKGLQKTFHYKQLNTGNINEVFPLLCPVREKDWLDGWNCTMIKSDSGRIEKDCVFTTPHHGKQDTVWHVTQYDQLNYEIEFLRVTPGESVVRIQIKLKEIGKKQTEVNIDYQYTGLNENQNNFIEFELQDSFTESMQWWEKAINYYLVAGTMLKKD